MIHQLDKNGRPQNDDVWTEEVITDEKGLFEIRDYAAPYKESKVGLEVSKEGYQAVYRTYTDYSDIEPQVFLVVLVPQSAANYGLHPTAN